MLTDSGHSNRIWSPEGLAWIRHSVETPTASQSVLSFAPSAKIRGEILIEVGLRQYNKNFDALVSTLREFFPQGNYILSDEWVEDNKPKKR
jgi:hypothetical protein